jgi:hypothetical protein
MNMLDICILVQEGRRHSILAENGRNGHIYIRLMIYEATYGPKSMVFLFEKIVKTNTYYFVVEHKS